MKAHISIHDVAPDTLGLVNDILRRLEQAGIDKVMLLVIPGLNWSEDQVNVLLKWSAQGHVLAGHGWVHDVKNRRNAYHKLHGIFLSRYVAEHLSLKEDEIADLMQRNYDWFLHNNLPAPHHYVPPAWALGKISVSRLADLPFQSVETLRGFWFPKENEFRSRALLGYEADTAVRAFFLRNFNAWNRRKVRRSSPIRISLHPHDFSLKLSDQILLDCRRYTCHPQPV